MVSNRDSIVERIEQKKQGTICCVCFCSHGQPHPFIIHNLIPNLLYLLFGHIGSLYGWFLSVTLTAGKCDNTVGGSGKLCCKRYYGRRRRRRKRNEKRRHISFGGRLDDTWTPVTISARMRLRWLIIMLFAKTLGFVWFWAG